jgi:SOS-response transcriptional repressor LexA
MITWEERIERIKEACSIKNNRQLEERLGLANGYINDLLKGKNKNPGKLAAALMKELLINPMWFEDETQDILWRMNLEKKTLPKPPLLKALDEAIAAHPQFAAIEERLTRIEERLERKNPVEGDFTGEPEPEYEEEEEQAQIPYVESIAAGPPIAQSEDQTGTASVPARLIKKGFRYYAADIQGTSMSEVGIRDGDRVLIRHRDTPVDGTIQVVRYQGKSTLKRLRELEGGGWEMHYEDGSGKVVLLDSGDYEVQGEFVAVLPQKAAAGGRKKDRRTHEKPLENR